jgi:sortase A
VRQLPKGSGTSPTPPASRLRRLLTLRNVGLLLIGFGLLAFLTPFALIGYGMWREQQLTQGWTASKPPATDSSLPETSVAPLPVSTPTAAPQRTLQAAFAMRVPKIGYYAAVQEGVSLGVLADGPGHYPSTAMPGKPGLVGIAGHNTFWIPFGKLGQGDAIALETRYGTFNYRVTETRIVQPDDGTALVSGSDQRLALTTCWPLWAGNMAPQRLVIFARQV